MSHIAIRLNLTPGTVYRCLLRLGGRTGGLYRVHGLALSYPSEQQVVVYEGVNSTDTGRLFCCSCADFALKFESADEPPPERVADLTSKGRF
jgi:hypothetical protein